MFYKKLPDDKNNLVNQLKANNKSFYFDYHDGEYGYNTSSTRGADTFVPFKSGISDIIFSTIAGNFTSFGKNYGGPTRSGTVSTLTSNKRYILGIFKAPGSYSTQAVKDISSVSFSGNVTVIVNRKSSNNIWLSLIDVSGSFTLSVTISNYNTLYSVSANDYYAVFAIES